jgi:hypothetical protein
MKTRHFPSGSTIVRPKEFTGVEIGLYQLANGLGAIAYSDRKQKHDFYYRFQECL